MDDRPTLLVVVPTYGHYDYAARAVRSALEHTVSWAARVLVVDDATPDHGPAFREHLAAFAARPGGGFAFYRFADRGGLTRSWNYGLQAAADAGVDCCCVTNSDVVFAPGWDRAVHALLAGGTYDLVGPLSNAPGTSAEQYVGRYVSAYDRSRGDDPEHLAQVQEALWRELAGAHRPAVLNGFCLVARTRTWWDHAYDRKHVFCPRNDRDGRGRPNPTPLMTLNEYELQRRWRAAGLRTGVALGAYVYHYRSVTRGDAYRCGDWFRRPGGGPGP